MTPIIIEDDPIFDLWAQDPDMQFCCALCGN